MSYRHTRFAALLFLLLRVPLSAEDFVLREALGREWANELVTFPLTPSQSAAVKSGAGVNGPDGRTVPSQLIEAAGKPRVAFQVTLAAGRTQRYRLAKIGTAASTDIEVSETAETVVLRNAHIGLALRKKLHGDEGPIAGVRLRTGVWTAGSKLEDGAEAESYRVELLTKGPVFAEALCHVALSGGGTWSLRFRMLRDEPVVLVSESMDARSGGRMLVPLGSEAFRPTRLLHRRGKGNIGPLESWTIAPGLAHTLEPWLRWWMSDRQGNWFAVYSPADLLMVAALRPAEWRDPEWRERAKQLAPVVEAHAEHDVVTLHMPLGGGQRKWLLGTPPRGESIAPLEAANRKVAPLPQRYVIKHGDFPLDEVKDYVLEWPGEHDDYPRLFVRKQDLADLRSKLPKDPTEVKRWTSQQPINKYNIEAPLLAYFASENEALGNAIVKRSNEWLDQVVDDGLLEQNGRVTLGVAPHMQGVLLLPPLNLTDAALGCPGVTPRLRKRMLAQLALLGYTVSREDYWSPSRGYSANPNMTTTVALYQTAVASLIPSHPRAREWAERGLTELKRQLREWSDENGGWLEAPHYAMVSLDHMLGAFLMASNAGFGHEVCDPQIRKVCEWLAKISTPRDRRTGGFRHYPPIGHTYMGEGTGMFGIVAGLWKDRDPAFAANMQWMCEEHGSPPIGLFGPFGTFSGYRKLLLSHGVAPEAPVYGSEWFRKTGVVLRSHFPSERETYLHLIAGSQHQHYDHDSGSIVVWGKGRLLADDFGYIGQHPARWHNQLTSPAVPGSSVMEIASFAPSERLDFVHGRRGAWQRRITFIKDAEPLGPTGFFIRDSHAADADATWRLWLTTKGIVVHGHGATVTGEDDVDLDIFVFEPAALKLRTEATVQKGMGRRDGKDGLTATSQTALVGTLRGRGTVSVLLWPRLKSEPPPKVSWFADGQGLQVETQAGTDYVLVADPPRKADGTAIPRELVSADAKVTFRCAAGAVQTRGKTATFTLATSGSIREGQRVLESPQPTARTFRTP